MSLFEDAAMEYQEIMNDDIGATVECVLTSPEGVSEVLYCRMSDISQTVDVNTREVIEGRQITLAVSLIDLDNVGFSNIRGIEKKTEKPWIAEYTNIIGVEKRCKVARTAPDSTLGSMILYLEETK